MKASCCEKSSGVKKTIPSLLNEFLMMIANISWSYIIFSIEFMDCPLPNENPFMVWPDG
jgi:hypothetical protein